MCPSLIWLIRRPPKIHVLGLPAQVLLAAGVTVWSTDFQGRTALALAAEGGHGNASLLLKVTPLMVHKLSCGSMLRREYGSNLRSAP